MSISTTKELQLIFVPSEMVMLHEKTDPQRVERLLSAVKRDGLLRNPPVVAQANNAFVVLDGATRTTVLKHMGAEHIVVQVVPYTDAEVRLEAWYHVLPSHAAQEVMDYVHAHSDIAHSASIEEAQQALRRRKAAAAILNDDGTAVLVSEEWGMNKEKLPSQENPSVTTAHARTIGEILRALVDVYGGAGEVFRIVHDELVETVQKTEMCPSVVMFPVFTHQEIINIATTSDVLPAGITRHLIPGRALNINLSIDTIMSRASLSEKNEWLGAWLTDKIMQKKVRYYHEPVFVFDD